MEIFKAIKCYAKKVIMGSSIITAALVFTGCCDKQIPLEPTIKIVYVDKPVPCHVPDISCDFEGPFFVPTQKLFDCVILQKHAIAACNLDNNNTK